MRTRTDQWTDGQRIERVTKREHDKRRDQRRTAARERKVEQREVFLVGSRW